MSCANCSGSANCAGGCGTAGCQGSTCGDSCGGCTGCSGSCKTGCSGSCKTGCQESCNGCTSCTGTCDGSCKGTCKTGCFNTCKGQCNVQCIGSEQDELIINLPDFPINRKIFASDIIPLQKAVIYQCNRRKINSTTILSRQSSKVEEEDINKMINDLNSIEINSIPFSLIEGQEIQKEEFKTIKKEIIDKYNEFIRVD